VEDGKRRSYIRPYTCHTRSVYGLRISPYTITVIYDHMYYGEIRSYTERIWHVYGRMRHRIRSFTTVYGARNRRPGIESLPMSNNEYSPIEHLVIENTVYFDVIDRLLSYVPDLCHLKFRYLDGCNCKRTQ
jgi:hypothetical protein